MCGGHTQAGWAPVVPSCPGGWQQGAGGCGCSISPWWLPELNGLSYMKTGDGAGWGGMLARGYSC